MDFSISFVKVFFIGLGMAIPLLVLFMGVISLLGLWIGRREKWTRFDSVYYAFITATTVGYGDMRPVSKLSKFLAVQIAFMGLIFTGMFVSIAINAASIAFKETQDMAGMQTEIQQTLEK
jgi:voltage-gated potassium channel